MVKLCPLTRGVIRERVFSSPAGMCREVRGDFGRAVEMLLDTRFILIINLSCCELGGDAWGLCSKHYPSRQIWHTFFV